MAEDGFSAPHNIAWPGSKAGGRSHLKVFRDAACHLTLQLSTETPWHASYYGLTLLITWWLDSKGKQKFMEKPYFFLWYGSITFAAFCFSRPSANFVWFQGQEKEILLHKREVDQKCSYGYFLENEKCHSHYKISEVEVRVPHWLKWWSMLEIITENF